jgi:hypothetical protein
MSSKRADEGPIPAWRSETLPQLRPDELERLVTAFRAARGAYPHGALRAARGERGDGLIRQAEPPPS